MLGRKNMNEKLNFLAYETVRQSGQTNMFDTTQVIELAEEMEGVTLTRQEVVRIMKNYSRLFRKYV